jgi:endoglucanase
VVTAVFQSNNLTRLVFSLFLLFSADAFSQNVNQHRHDLISTHPECVDPDGDGWGWNGVSSCRIDAIRTPDVQEPVETIAIDPEPDSSCVDPDGDGWGWNGISSCRVSAKQTSTEEGDLKIPEHTADPVTSCHSQDSASTCVATESPASTQPQISDNNTTPVITEASCLDPDGDGWGWNGVASCRVTSIVSRDPVAITDSIETTAHTDLLCVDSDGDGWGWNGVASCNTNDSSNTSNANTAVPVEDAESVVSSDNTTACIDPDGDGWGWDGYQSCVVESAEQTVAIEPHIIDSTATAVEDIPVDTESVTIEEVALVEPVTTIDQLPVSEETIEDQDATQTEPLNPQATPEHTEPAAINETPPVEEVLPEEPETEATADTETLPAVDESTSVEETPAVGAAIESQLTPTIDDTADAAQLPEADLETEIADDPGTEIVEETEAEIAEESEAEIVEETGAEIVEETGAQIVEETGAEIVEETETELVVETLIGMATELDETIENSGANIEQYLTPHEINGKLQVCYIDNLYSLCNQYGDPVQLTGMSSTGIQWSGWHTYDRSGCLTGESLDLLSMNWKTDIFRIAVYPKNGGYESNPEEFFRHVNTIIAELSDRGMYAIVDYHILVGEGVSGNPLDYAESAESFFRRIVQDNKHRTNVLYEIANEPQGPDLTWDHIRQYADRITQAIREEEEPDNNAVVIVGTNAWSSFGMAFHGDFYEILDNPVDDSGNNLMYAFHFYANDSDHNKNGYLDGLSESVHHIPVFVTEWGTQYASGGGVNNFSKANQYLELMQEKNISWTMWNFSDTVESSAVWNDPNFCGMDEDWENPDHLSPTGLFIKQVFENKQH